MAYEVNGVQFEEPESTRSSFSRGGNHLMYAKMVASNEPPKIITWLIEHKIAHSEQQAVNLVGGCVFLIFLVSGYLFFFGQPKSQIEYAAELQEQASQASH